MNAKLTALFAALTLVASSLAQAGQPLGTAKARGDYRPFWESQQSVNRSVCRSRPTYRYTAPRNAPVIVRSAPATSAEDGASIAQAPVEARRFSQAPAAEDETVATATSCPETPAVESQPSSGRRYSYAPGTRYSGSPVRRYSTSGGRGARELWALPKADPGKYSSR